MARGSGGRGHKADAALPADASDAGSDADSDAGSAAKSGVAMDQAVVQFQSFVAEGDTLASRGEHERALSRYTKVCHTRISAEVQPGIGSKM